MPVIGIRRLKPSHIDPDADTTRLLALEIARPLQIDEDDCNVVIDHPSLDSALFPQGSEPSISSPSIRQPHPLELMTAVARVVARIKKTLRRPHVGGETLSMFEKQLESVMNTFPEPIHPRSSTYLDPALFWVTTTVANTKYMLHRQNISPRVSPTERAAAMNNCVLAAQTTARTVSRSMQPCPSSPRIYLDPARASMDWESRIRSFTPSLLCTHLWRCILMLSLALDFTSAATCARVSATIGELRPINTACGRNLVFFLERLKDRVASGLGQRHQLENDEEMLAYVSGDLQADPVHAWVWERESPVAGLSGEPHVGSTSGFQQINQPPEIEVETDDWGGWARVQSLLVDLQQDHEQRQALQRLPPLRPQPTGGGPTSEGGSMAPRQRGRHSSEAAERVSIASIIEAEDSTRP